MQCAQCGAEIEPNSVFCHKCGSRMEERPSAQQPQERHADEGRDRGSQFRDALSEKSREVRDSAEDPEDDLWSGTFSTRAMYGQFILAGIGSVALLVLGFMFFQGNAIAWWVALGAIALLWAFLGLKLLIRKWGINYQLSSQRFIHRKGILNQVTDRIEVIDIDDVGYEQGIFERFFGVGSIKIISSDRSDPELLMKGIADVQNVFRTIDDARRKERMRRGLHIESV